MPSTEPLGMVYKQMLSCSVQQPGLKQCCCSPCQGSGKIIHILIYSSNQIVA